VGANSKIEWTHHTFNIVWGCQKVSPACTNCYAAEFAQGWPHQHDGIKKPLLWGPGSERKTLSDGYWKDPEAWDRKAAKAGERHRVFCSSMADVFEDHPTVNEQRERLWKLIDATPNLDWLLLTKRPENLERFLPWYESGLSPKNVWLGVTAENQKYLDIRVPKLLLAAARVHFISYEPALGPIDASFYLQCEMCKGEAGVQCEGGVCPNCMNMPRLDWVICGGESGQSARPMHPEWARSIRDQVAAAAKNFFFKQWGEWTPGVNVARQTGVVKTATFFGTEVGFSHENLANDDGHRDDEPDLYRVGKEDAGRVLDGRTWDEMPREAGL
jgi:protein gp37